MAIMAAGRFRKYNNPGAMLYVADDVYSDGNWPFEERDMIKVTIENGRVVERKMRWFEMLDWEGSRGENKRFGKGKIVFSFFILVFGSVIE